MREHQVDISRFQCMSFDVYGTLIDWESGIIAALRPVLIAHGIDWADEEILDAFAQYETVAQHPYKCYTEVLKTVLRRIGEEHGFGPTRDELDAFGNSVPDWPACEDSADALASLKRHIKLAVITNCDDHLFAESNRKLGVEFDVIVTAEQARAYKPSLEPFHLAFERIGGQPERLLHVAQSLYHDHEPGKKLGLTTVWINRPSVREGLGAAPPADAQPDLELPDLRSLANMFAEDR